MNQDRLWITDPRRTTCLAEVIEVRGNQFAVDKALFAPRSTACRHPQNHDQGTVWIQGEKRRLHSVRDDGGVWYALRGTTPDVGATLQCELNQEVRHLASCAHTAMHLWMAAMGEATDAPPMVQSPEVKGGGHFRITYAWPVGPKVLASVLESVMNAVRQNLLVEQSHVPRSVAERMVRPQAFQPPDPVPVGDPLPVVSIGELVLPCDGSHVDRTSRIDNVQVSHARAGKDGFVVGCRVTPASHF